MASEIFVLTVMPVDIEKYSSVQPFHICWTMMIMDSLCTQLFHINVSLEDMSCQFK